MATLTNMDQNKAKGTADSALRVSSPMWTTLSKAGAYICDINDGCSTCFLKYYYDRWRRTTHI